MKIKTYNIFFAALCIGLIIALSPALAAGDHYSVYLNGPGISKHFAPYHRRYNDFHLGIGGEFYYYTRRLILGFHGHYMFNDSVNNSAYWAGFVTGIQLGNKDKIWFEPFVIIGAIKKNEYNSGKFGPFVLPVLSAGYKRIGFNLSFIPKLPRVTYPIVLIQLKVRIV